MKEGQFLETFCVSGNASAALIGYRAARNATTLNETTVIAAGSATTEPLGLITGDAATNENVGVAFTGTGMAEVDGSSVNIAAGDKLKSGALGVLVKALLGDTYIAEALEPCTAANLAIRVIIGKGIVSGAVSYTDKTAATGEAVTVNQLGSGFGTVIASYAGAMALAFPSAATVRPGTTILVKKTGSAGAVTITPAAGTIAGGATYVALDAQNDMAYFISDGTNWILGPNNIA